MKALYVISFLILPFILFGQLDPVPFKIITNGGIIPLDSVHIILRDDIVTNSTGESILYRERRYQFVNNRIVSIRYYKNQTIEYLEFREPIDEFPFCTGTLTRNMTNYTLLKSLERTKGSPEKLKYDTVFLMIPNGEWKVYNPDFTAEQIHFTNGKKNGKSTRSYYRTCSREHIPLRETVFKNDSIIDSTIFEIPVSLLTDSTFYGKWYVQYCAAHWINDEYQLILQRQETTDFGNSSYQYFDFNPDGTFDARRYLSCGVGVTRDELNPTGQWLFKDGILKIGGENFQLQFITKDHCILYWMKSN